MDMRTATKTVYAAFATAWGSTTPIVIGNESWPEPASPWVRLSMRETSSIQLTMGEPGNKIYERRCSVYVQVFSPADAGEGQLLDLAQQARNVFEGLSLSVSGETIDFFQVNCDPGDDEAHLHVSLVEARCRYQQRK
jgi:hypothetical protein